MRTGDDDRPRQVVECIGLEGVHRPGRSPALVIADLDAEQLDPTTREPLFDSLHALPVETLGVPRDCCDAIAETHETGVELGREVVTIGDGGFDRIECAVIKNARKRGNKRANIRDPQVGIEADHPQAARGGVIGEEEQLEVVTGFDDHPPTVDGGRVARLSITR